jgi:hypothetical protein
MQRPEKSDDAVRRNRDVNIRGVLLFGFWLVAGAILVQLAMWGFFRVLKKEESSRDKPLPAMIAASLKRTPPEPRLEPNPLLPRARVRAEEDAVLSSYGWVDKTTGVVRVPITRAMEILVARGLPSSKPMPAGAPAGPAEQKR